LASLPVSPFQRLSAVVDAALRHWGKHEAGAGASCKAASSPLEGESQNKGNMQIADAVPCIM